MSDASETSHDPARSWRRPSRRGWIAIGGVVFLIVLRIALPTIAEKVIESQGSTFLEGQLMVENVDLWLLSGAVALEGVALWPDGEAPTEGQTPEDPPLVAWDRIYVDVGWMPLFDKIANVQDFELDGLSVNVARLQDGTLVLPDLRDLPQEEEEEDDSPSEPFGVLVDRAALLNAKVRVRDDVPGTPTFRELTLPSVEVQELAIGDKEVTEPGHIVVNAGLKDGTIRIDARISERDGGFHTETQIDIANLPLDQLHVHEPSLGWTGSSGRVAASVRIVIDPEARIVLSGTTAVTDVHIEVPDEAEPGLAWKRFDLEINEVDVAQQRVDLARVALDGASILLRPLEDPPAPILPDGLVSSDAEPEASVPTDVTDPVVEPDAEPVVEAAAAEPDAEPVAPADWTIRLASLEITDTSAGLVLEQGPATGHIGKLVVTDVDATTTSWAVGHVELTDSSGAIDLATGSPKVEIVSLTVDGLTSDPSKPIHVVSKIKEDASVIDVDATLVQQPQNIRAKIDLENIALGRYADLSGASPVHIPSGTLQAALAIETDGDDARIAGQMAIDGLQVLTQDGKEDFTVAWESLSLDIRALELVVTDPEAPMNLELTELRLTSPNIRATLTSDGIVLPTVREADAASPTTGEAAAETTEPPGAPAVATPEGAAEDPPTAEAEPTETSPTEAAAADHAPVLQSGLVAQTESVGVDEIAEFAEPAANLPLGLVVDRLVIEDGTFRVVDRAVRPTYRGKITDFQFDITGVELPYDVAPTDGVFDKMALDLNAPGGAPVKIRAGTEAKGVQIDASVTKLPLSQFNPYVRQAAGYTVLEGAATVESSVLWAKQRYQSDTDITLNALDVGSDSGGTLFRDYFGISISAALALMRDVTGKIGLGIPVNGSVTEGTEVGVGSVVGQAITKAIFNAITSPLKMLGMVTMLGEKVGDITPVPVPFAPGSAEIAKSSEEQVERIGDVLASTPSIKIELVGRANADDVRGLKERAVLAGMQGESGFFGGIRNLASGGSRNTIRTALEDGDTSGLSESDQASLDELIDEETVNDDDLRKLANDRAQTLYQTLLDEDGVPEEQISIGAAEVSDDGGSDVRVNLLSR